MSTHNIFMILFLAVLTSSACHKNDMDHSTTVARNVIETPFTNPLAIPPSIDGRNATLSAQAGSTVLGNGITVSSLGYGGATMLGPSILIERGERLNLAFTNNLSEMTNIHWHGLVAPASQDGYPTDVTLPGGLFQYDFPVVNGPGTYWYHPHPDAMTASQAYRGLAGFFLVSAPEETALGLPSGDYDIPLVVQDKRLTGGLSYNPDANDQTIGLFGESILVNGTPGAVLDVATRTYRFRLLNGSNARIYNFALSTGSTFTLIGTDGGLLTNPQTVSNVLLAPGERAEILVEFNSFPLGAEVFLQSKAFSGSTVQGAQTFSLLKFNVSRLEAESFVLPATLLPIDPLPASGAARTRTFNIGHSMDMGGQMGHGGTSAMVMHTIDGLTFDHARTDVVVKAGEIEIWEFDNSKGTETHPMHLHGIQFQVLDRTGGRSAIQPWEQGWKDTVLAFPGEKVRVIMRFPDNLGKFVFHCHNLEHEDGGMMLNFEIQ